MGFITFVDFTLSPKMYNNYTNKYLTYLKCLISHLQLKLMNQIVYFQYLYSIVWTKYVKYFLELALRGIDDKLL